MSSDDAAVEARFRAPTVPYVGGSPPPGRSTLVRGGAPRQPRAGAVIGTAGRAFSELWSGAVVDDYRVEALLAVGGMGSVYAAHHVRTGQRVAIKVIAGELCGDTTACERFVREARIVTGIRHPNIIDVFGFGRLADGRLYHVMEHLRGRSLADRIDDGPPVDRLEAIEILLQICDSLAAAHERGVVHRDLKPDNIFLTADACAVHVKLLDFGIAKLAGDDESAKLTQTGALVGTPRYMSPEQARARAVDHRSDVYSLGVIAYELFSGQVPFCADNAADLVAMHLYSTAHRLDALVPDLPASLVELVDAMLAKEPSERPALDRVAAVLRDVAAVLSRPRPLPGDRGRAGRAGPGAIGVRVIEGWPDDDPAWFAPTVPERPQHRPRRGLWARLARQLILFAVCAAFAGATASHDAAASATADESAAVPGAPEEPTLAADAAAGASEPSLVSSDR